MAEYSRFATGSVTQTATGNSLVIALPFRPNVVKVTNYTASASFAVNGVPGAEWYASMGTGVAVARVVGTGPVLTTGAVLSAGITPFSAGSPIFGAQIGVATSTKGATTAFTTSTPHGYSTGDVVFFQGLFQTASTGMPQLCGIPFRVTVTGASAFTIAWDSSGSNYTSITTPLNGAAYVKKLTFPYIYPGSVSAISAISLGTTTTVTTTGNHNFVVGQQVAFRIPSQWGTTQLNSLPNALVPGDPVYGYILSIPSAQSFVVNINSTGYTAFSVNQTVTSVPGMDFPQVVAVGDVNSGGWPYTGGSFYPSPIVNTVYGPSSSLNGPTIQGAFINNTSSGFVIGNGNVSVGGVANTNSRLSGSTSDVLYWEAYLTDM